MNRPISTVAGVLDRRRVVYLTQLVVTATLLFSAVLPAISQQTSHQFTSKACGFRLTLPAGWTVRLSRSKKCTYAFARPNRLDEGVEVAVRDGALEDGTEDLGFRRDNGKWMLQGEDYSEATVIENKNWVGVQGRAASRIYDKKGYAGLGDQARAVLFDRNHRIAEITCFANTVVPGCLEGFEFLGQAQALN